MCMLNIFLKILLILITFFYIPFGYGEEIFLSLKKNKVNVRYGPGFDFPVKYIYKKINLPVIQIDKKENFRRIIDIKNNSGWVHLSQLKKINSTIVLKDKILFKKSSFFFSANCKNKKRKIINYKKL